MRLQTPAVVVLLLSAVSLALAQQPPAAEFHARRSALAAKLNGGAALLFGNDEPREEYQTWRQNEDFFYFTGWNEPGAVLLVEAAYTPPADTANRPAGMPTLAPEPFREILFLPERNTRLELYTGVKLDAHTPNAPAVAGVDEVRQLSELPAELVRMAQHTTRLAALYTDGDDAKVSAALTLLGLAYARATPASQPLAPFARDLRSIKSPAEIQLLRQASEASNAAHRMLFTAVRDGASERTLDGLIDATLKANGCERPSYPSIVGSGVHSTELHYSTNSDTLHAGDLVVIDAAGERSMYASDITRTFPISGHFSARQRELYDIVLGAQRAAQAAFVSGQSRMGSRFAKDTTNSLDKVAFDYINTHGKDLHGQPLGKYFIHGLGHGVGIDVHDPFDAMKPFGPGSVFTIEPGIYIPEEKIGIRIEDTFYVDASGKLISFQASLPHTADEVEAAMRHHNGTR